MLLLAANRLAIEPRTPATSGNASQVWPKKPTEQILIRELPDTHVHTGDASGLSDCKIHLQ